jgi:hypothetical protein
MGFRVRGTELLVLATVVVAAATFVGDWVAGFSLLVLWFGVRLLLTDDRIPVLAVVFAYQWMQVTIGIFYSAATGRRLPAQIQTDYRPMVLIGLGCVMALAIGLRLGIYLIRDARENREERPVSFLTMPVLVVAYVVSVASEATILNTIGDFPSLRQILITMTVVRLGLLFLVMRRFCHPVFRPHYLAAIVGAEVLLGLTGYFASFKDPLVLAAIVMFEVFDYRKSTHWAAFTVLMSTGALLALMWMGVRGELRREIDEMDPMTSTSKSERVGRVNTLATEFFSGEASQLQNTADTLVDRMWAIHYPALAIARVPSVLSHTDGTLIWAALVHVVTPRVFFPGKADLPSDSEMVKKYSGVYVAGAREGTSIAFGYAAESYIDFGVPGMFVPVLLFGVVLGGLYAWFLRTIWHRELAVAVVIVVFWLSLYLFERSWANMLGMSASLIVYLGFPITLLDWVLVTRRVRSQQQRFDPEAQFRRYSDMNANP